MSSASSRRSPAKLMTGLIIVIAIHLLLAYGLVSGSAEEGMDKAVVTETNLLEASFSKPPPPPSSLDLPPPSSHLPPQSVYLPPIEVPTQPSAAQPVVATSVMPPPVQEPGLQVLSSPTAITARPSRIDASDPACKPELPAATLHANARGVTRMRFTVDAQGKVTNAEVVGSSGATHEHRLLDDAAEAALSRCSFTPGIDERGNLVGTVVAVDWDWTLNQ